MMDKEDIALVRRIVRDEFWEIFDSEVLPVLKDYVGIKVDASRDTSRMKSALPEDSFNLLTWQDESGVSLGAFQVAYKNQNLPEKWQYCFNVLKANNAVIGKSFHQEGYVHRYWIYSEKYDDRVFRKKLTDKEA